jgi:hypothetical protein
MTELEAVGKATLSVHGDVYRLTWPVQIEAEVDRITEHRDELTAEVTIRSSRHPSPGLLHSARLNLMSTQTRRSLANALAEREPELDWPALVEAMCYLVRERYRVGDPTIDMRAYVPSGRSRWLVEPFLEHGGPTVIFGDGDVGKSTVAAGICVTAATGQPVLGQLVGDPVAVLYDDHETDEDTFHEKLVAVCAGAGIRELPKVYYRRAVASLRESAPALRRQIAELGIGMVVIDSLGMASGGDPQAPDVAIALFAAIRSLGVPTLAIDHIAKNAADQGKAFGSVYKHNGPRLTWRQDKAQEEGSSDVVIALVNHKRNNGPKLPRRGYRMEFEIESDHLRTVRFDLADLARDYPEKATLRQRILAELQAGGVQPDSIAAALQADAKQVRARVGELVRKGVIRQMPDGTVWLASERVAS